MILTGAVLIVASFLKIHMLTTQPVKTEPFWESWLFFVIQIPLVLGLGIWLVSGLFRMAAWLLGTLGLLVFLGDTLYKAFSGAESCGCFGSVEVDPWVTLFAFNLPFLALMLIFRPKGEKLLPPPWPNPNHFLGVAVPTFLLLPAVVVFLFVHKVEPVRPVLGQNGQAAPMPSLADRQPGQIADEPGPEVSVEIQSPAETEPNPPLSEQIPAEPDVDIPGVEPIEPDNLEIPDQAAPEPAGTEPDIPEPKELEPAPAKSEKTEPNDAQTPAAETSEPNKMAADPNAGAKAADPDTAAKSETGPAEPKPTPAPDEWEMLKMIDIADHIREGMSITLFFHSTCPTCREAIPQYEEALKALGEIPITVAYVEIPPYDPADSPIPEDAIGIYGQLAEPGVDEKGRKKKWYIGTPLVVVTLDGKFLKAWPEGTAPEFDELLDAVFSAPGG